MDFIRRYLFELICGLIAVAGIVAGAVAYSGYGTISAELADAASLARDLEQYRGPRDVCNRQKIDAEQKRNEQVDRQLDQVTEAAKQMNQHQPLREDVFPSPLRQDSPYLFRADYRDKFKEFLDVLQAGDAPDQDEIQDMQERINQEQRVPEDQMLGLAPTAGAPLAAKPAERKFAEVSSRSWAPDGQNIPIEELARTDAAVRAALVKAGRVRIYASLEAFDIVDSVYTLGPEPPLSDMWFAQLKLWVQENVVRGLAEANARAAQRLQDAGERPNVTNLPAKHLLNLGVTNYVEAVEQAGGAKSGGGFAGMGARGMMDLDAIKMSGGGGGGARSGSGGSAGFASAVESFTHRTSTDLYDVVQFRVQFVVDARELLHIINAICRQDFITPINVSFQTLAPNTTYTGYVYGSDPVVEATVDFECCFFRELYAPLMPEEVKALRGIASTGASAGGRPMSGGGSYSK